MKKQKVLDPAIEEVKSKLPKRSAYQAISNMISGKYTAGTIKQMFLQNRTMSPIVMDAAQQLIDLIYQEPKTQGYDTNE